MSSTRNKPAWKIDAGQSVPAKKRGVTPLRQGPLVQGRTIKTSALGSAGNGGGTRGSSQEELYELHAHPEGSTLPFAMMIGLTPEILEELKHAEAKGVAPRIKCGDNFGSHVIQVGPETIKFSSAPELGGLCDIYTEQIEENGQFKVLREAASAWRKLSLQHIISATEKGHVKQCTAEAEKRENLHKSIEVDHNTQMSIPQAALTEVDTNKSLPGMEHEPSPKKRKVTKSPMPSVQKLSNTTAVIGSHYLPFPDSTLPELMSTVVRETPGSPLVALPGSKGKPTNGGEACVPIVKKALVSQKQSAGSKANITNIRNLVISFLKESPKGMTIKALEKAVTESLSVNPGRKLIEKIIKSIATFHAPGKYILNPGIEKETFVEVAVGSSGKSHETSCGGAREEEPPTDARVETICQKEINPECPEGSYSKTHDSPGKHVSPWLVNSHPCVANEFDGRSPRHEEVDATAAGTRDSDSSSTNESESESDTSGNGSASSATESSSGSESDASSSSRDASMDEDVDIMSDGEDEKKSDIRQQESQQAEDVKLSANEASMLQADFRNTEEIESGVSGRRNRTTPEMDFRNTEEFDSGASGRRNPATPEIEANFRITEIESEASGRHNPTPEIQVDFRNTEENESGASGRRNPTTEIEAGFQNTEEIESGASGRCHPTPEIQPSSPGEVRPTSEDMKVREPDHMDDGLLETVFRPDDVAGVMIHSNVLLGNDSLNFDHISSTMSKEANTENPPLITPNKEKETFSETPDRNREQERNGSQERRKRYRSDESTSLSHGGDARAGKPDILVHKIFEDKESHAHWLMDRSPSCKTFEMAENKDIDQHSQKGKASYLKKKENSNSVLNSDKVSNSSLSSEARKRKLDGSSLLGEKNIPQRKVGRPSREANSGSQLQMKQDSSMKSARLTTTDIRNKHGKEADKDDGIDVKSSERNGRVSSQRVNITSRPGESSSLYKGFLGERDANPSKEGVNESSRHTLTNSGETSARLGKSVKARQCPRTNADSNKATLLGFTKELGSAHDVLELARTNKHTEKANSMELGIVQDALELARNNTDTEKSSWPSSLELAERTGSVEGQVQKPLKDADFLKKGGAYGRNDGLKEKELTAKPPNGSNSPKEGRKMGTACMDSGHSSRSEHAFSRGSSHERKRNDSKALELGEFRELPSENELGEAKSPCLRSEKRCFEATSRATSNIKTFSLDSERPLPFEATSRATSNIKTFSPDSDKPLPVSRSRVSRRPDFERPLHFSGSMPNASPGQGESSLLQEFHNSKERITFNAKRTGQSMQKLRTDQVRQSHHRRPVSTIKEREGSLRSGGSDVRNHRAGSKETSRKSKLLGDSKASALSQEKESNARPFSDDKKLRQDCTAKDLHMSYKKQTSQSSEVQGSEFFTPYEKKEPELRGTIYSLDQFRDYYKEYNEKYPIYAQLNASLENDKESFETFLKDIEEAKRRGDMVKLANIHGRVRKEYFQCHKRSKRMKHTFKLLHKELQVIKQHCKDYAQKSRRL